MDITSLPTPALVIDEVRVRANIERWQSLANQYGVALRPHIKTHKSFEIARMQIGAGAHGITSAKLSEAEVFIDEGFNDCFVAYPIIGIDKCAHAAQLALRCRLIVGVDSLVGITQLSVAMQAARATVGVRVEIDTGLHRCGVDPAAAIELCRAVLAAPGLSLDGIFTYRGAWFAGANGRSGYDLGIEESQMMVAVATELRANGIAINAISVGSTPTGAGAVCVPGITEIRPGTYVFGDDMQLRNGSCTVDQVGLSIWCTVISRPDAQTATIDGGAKTFSGDVFPDRMGLLGYATGVDYAATLVRMSEEHGVLQLAPGVDLPIGTRIAMRPIHVCTTVNLSDEMYLRANTGDCTPIRVVARGKRS